MVGTGAGGGGGVRHGRAAVLVWVFEAARRSGFRTCLSVLVVVLGSAAVAVAVTVKVG
jgi:hypothetical protein